MNMESDGRPEAMPDSAGELYATIRRLTDQRSDLEHQVTDLVQTRNALTLAMAILRAERDHARADLRGTEAKMADLVLVLQRLVDEYEGFRSAHGWLPGNPATREARAALPDIVIDPPHDPPEVQP